jgi:hypothetical protein
MTPWLLAVGLALAAPEPEVIPADAAPAGAHGNDPGASPDAADPPPPRWRWGGIAIPTLKYNSTDGLGLGAGLELYERRADGAQGYRYRLSLSTFWTTSGNYASNWVQLEHRGRVWWLTRFTWSLWRNMVYVGAGGDDVSVRNGEEAFGNTVNGPSLLGTLVIPVTGTPLQVWLQGYARYAAIEARPGGPLDVRRPYGVDGGFTFDVSAGLALNELDQWPVPHKGVRGEASFRLGGSFSPDFHPITGLNFELAAYWPLVGRHLVLGARTLFDRTWGDRPFFEQELLGGQWRDELAYEQMLTGYARSRTRGDGVFATMVELRPYFGSTGHRVFDIGFYLSAYAETAFLLRGSDPGPHMPSVGVAPLLVWQGTVELRPFLAWGWMADRPRGPRTPELQIGVSLLSPL